MSYLVDTNVLCELIKLKPNKMIIEWFDSIPETSLYLSVLTLGEIRKGIEKLTDSKKKENYKIWLEYSLPQRFGERLLNVNSHVAERWGRLLAEMNRSLPAIDSLIGATALHYDLTLVTRNAQDFKFPGLEVVNPWEMSLA